MVRGVSAPSDWNHRGSDEVGAQVVALALGPFHVASVARELREARRVDVAEERDGIAIGTLPSGGVDVLEEPAGRLVPRPAQVRGELLERAELGWHDGPDGELANRLHRSTIRVRMSHACERISRSHRDRRATAGTRAHGETLAAAVRRPRRR